MGMLSPPGEPSQAHPRRAIQSGIRAPPRQNQEIESSGETPAPRLDRAGGSALVSIGRSRDAVPLRSSLIRALALWALVLALPGRPSAAESVDLALVIAND